MDEGNDGIDKHFPYIIFFSPFSLRLMWKLKKKYKNKKKEPDKDPMLCVRMKGTWDLLWQLYMGSIGAIKFWILLYFDMDVPFFFLYF